MQCLTKSELSNILSKSRTNAKKTQVQMAKLMDRSVGTIKNWESGYATPDFIETIHWFEVLGVNPLRSLLDYIYPDVFNGNSATDSDERLRNTLVTYFNNVATTDEIRKLSYCIFGNTGSSWQAQVNMWCAHNHSTMRSRVNVAQMIYDSYEMEEAQNKLINTDHAMPDIEGLYFSIQQGKKSVKSGKEGYVNQLIHHNQE